MLKKVLIWILVLIVVLSALTVGAANIIRRKAPDLLREAIGRSLNKKVVIENIEYRFPRTFQLDGFQVLEIGQPFDGETNFYVDRVTLHLSPMSFSQKALIITQLQVESADIVIRKLDDKLHHVLSGVPKRPRPASEAGASADAGKSAGVNLPLEIHLFELKNCRFKFIDYDVQSSGFVMVFDKINAKIRDIYLPPHARKTSYSIEAEALQSRDQRRAKVRASGWTDFETYDTDATLALEGAHLPYFRPYYAQITGAALEDGYADVHAGVKMENRVLDLNAGFELSSLLFEAYESDDQLFGLKANEVLSFLKDSSGRFRFQIAVKWNTADRSVKLKDVFRQSIERSLRQTMIGNVGNILMNALQKVSEGGDSPGKKGGVEEKIKKIKDFFKY